MIPCKVPMMLLVLSFFPFTAPAQEEPTAKPIPELGPVGEIVKLHTGFKFTEGPAADAQGNVFFTDIPNNSIHQVDAAGKLSRITDKSNHANGLMFTSSGKLIACEMDGQVAAWDLSEKGSAKRRVLVGKHQDKRFNAPNDLVLDSSGGIYFTDPHFRAPKPLPQGKMGVYYLAPSQKVTRLIDDLPAPNGVILSPDEKTLYVIPSGPFDTQGAEMMAYPVLEPGKLGKGRVFCTLAQPKGTKKPRGGDGLTVDVRGNLYITSALGLQVFNPQGKSLGIIRFPEKPANVTFGGKDRKTLYVTARTSLYTAKMRVAGHVFRAGKKLEAK